MKNYLFAVVATVLLPIAVRAGDLCLTDADGLVSVKFTKVKELKPGIVAPLQGAAVLGATGIPVAGVAVAAADGSVNYGFTAYASAVIGINFAVSVYGADSSLAGTGTFILDDGLGSGPISVMAADCKVMPGF